MSEGLCKQVAVESYKTIGCRVVFSTQNDYFVKSFLTPFLIYGLSHYLTLVIIVLEKPFTSQKWDFTCKHSIAVYTENSADLSQNGDGGQKERISVIVSYGSHSNVL